eukprot:7309693-Prymnesium_polylepis.1
MPSCHVPPWGGSRAGSRVGGGTRGSRGGHVRVMWGSRGVALWLRCGCAVAAPWLRRGCARLPLARVGDVSKDAERILLDLIARV